MKKSGIKFNDNSKQEKSGNIWPIVTTATRPSNPKDGEVVINSTLGYTEYYDSDSGQWKKAFS